MASLLFLGRTPPFGFEGSDLMAHAVDGRNLASLLKQIHAISLRLAPRPLLNIGAQFGQVGLGHARFRPLTAYERLCSSQLNVK